MPTDSITKDFVVKDYDAYLRLLQEIENKERPDCNNCPHLNITEEQQHYLMITTGTKSMPPHICTKYNERVLHFPYREPMIHPCPQCEKENSYGQTI